MKRLALFSSDGKFRLELQREWDPLLPTVGWIILNPSTGNAETDDPTIRRCIGFASKFGYGGLRIYNLFAYCATDPNDLVLASQHMDVTGDEEGALALMEAGLAQCQGVIAAWGARGGIAAERAEMILARYSGMYCLGKTKLGQPKHPLYLPASTQLELL